jgi:hypothetical protein
VSELGEASIAVATAVVECAAREGVGTLPAPAGAALVEHLREKFWRPRYPRGVLA